MVPFLLVLLDMVVHKLLMVHLIIVILNVKPDVLFVNTLQSLTPTLLHGLLINVLPVTLMQLVEVTSNTQLMVPVLFVLMLTVQDVLLLPLLVILVWLDIIFLLQLVLFVSLTVQLVKVLVHVQHVLLVMLVMVLNVTYHKLLLIVEMENTLTLLVLL